MNPSLEAYSRHPWLEIPWKIHPGPQSRINFLGLGLAFGAARMLRDVVSSIPDGGWGWLWWCEGLDDLGHLGRIVGITLVDRDVAFEPCEVVVHHVQHLTRLPRSVGGTGIGHHSGFNPTALECSIKSRALT